MPQDYDTSDILAQLAPQQQDDGKFRRLQPSMLQQYLKNQFPTGSEWKRLQPSKVKPYTPSLEDLRQFLPSTRTLETIGRGTADTLAAPLISFENLAKQGARAPSDMLSEDIGDMLTAGPGAMLPGFGRALGGTTGAMELGAQGSKVLQRSDAMKLASELKQQGKSHKEIAEALNERFAPLIDEGWPIQASAVARRDKRGEFELGAMGGGGKTPPKGPNYTTEDVLKWLGEENIPIKSVDKSPGGSTYIRYDVPGNDGPKSNNATPTIRIADPNNVHQGNAPKNMNMRVNRIDTAGVKQGKEDTLIKNAAGQKYDDFDTFKNAVRWRVAPHSGLVPPGSEPNVLKNWKDPELYNATQLEKPLPPHPDQQSMMDALLALDKRQKPDSIVGGNPENLFSSNKIQERTNLVSPKDFKTGAYPDILQKANFDPPFMQGLPPEQRARFEQRFEELLNALKDMKRE